MDSAGATTIVGCPPPTRPFVVFGFVVFKVNISSSLDVAAAALTVCVEAGGVEFALTTEAQDFIECIGTL
jgi:putative hemolysin